MKSGHTKTGVTSKAVGINLRSICEVGDWFLFFFHIGLITLVIGKLKSPRSVLETLVDAERVKLVLES